MARIQPPQRPAEHAHNRPLRDGWAVVSPAPRRRPRLGSIALVLTIGVGLPVFAALCVLTLALAGGTTR